MNDCICLWLLVWVYFHQSMLCGYRCKVTYIMCIWQLEV